MQNISNYYKWVIVLIVICFHSNLYADNLVSDNDIQQNNYQKYFFKFNSGFNLSKVKSLSNSPTNDINSKYTLGVPINMGIDIKYKPKLGIELGINYQFINTRLEQSKNGSNFTYSKEEKFRFIGLPILLYFESDRFNIRPAIYTGLSLNYLLNSYSQYRITTNPADNLPDYNSKKYDTTEKHNRWNMTYTFGVGLSYYKNFNCFYFNAFYNLGLTNITNVNLSAQDFDYGTKDLYLNNLEILIGIKLPLYFNN